MKPFPLPIDDAFFQRLRGMDRELFLRLKRKGCPRRGCGSPLDTSNYPRKVRGMGNQEELRFSLCCRREGCRHRLTPPSLRFLGRRVHAAWWVIWIHEFRTVLGYRPEIARQTLARWQNFWREQLLESSPFMRRARALGLLPPAIGDSPSLSAILRAFGFPDPESWIPCLRFFTQFP